MSIIVPVSNGTVSKGEKCSSVETSRFETRLAGRTVL